MLEGTAVVLSSYSVGYHAEVAGPVAERLRHYGLRAILVGAEPLPAGVESTAEAKVSYFFDHADMAVYLATPEIAWSRARSTRGRTSSMNTGRGVSTGISGTSCWCSRRLT
jgi:hypothetical protein